MSYVQSLATISDTPFPAYTHTGNKKCCSHETRQEHCNQTFRKQPKSRLVERSLDPRQWSPTWAA